MEFLASSTPAVVNSFTPFNTLLFPGPLAQHAAGCEPGARSFAYVHALTVRTPCERTAGSRQAILDQSPSSAASVTSRSAPGAPDVNRAGVSSPRSVISRYDGAKLVTFPPERYTCPWWMVARLPRNGIGP